MSFALAVILIVSASVAECHKILVTVPGIAASNNFLMYRTADLITSPQHEVTVFKYDIIPSARTPKLNVAKEIHIQPIKESELSQKLKEMMDTIPWEKHLSGLEMMSKMSIMKECLFEACKTMIADEKLINKLKAEKFDVAIIHVADICGFGLMKVLGIQSYSLFSTAFMVDPIAWISGSPNPVSYVPSAVTEFMPTMSFVQRAQNVLASAVTVGVFVYFIVPEYTTLFRKQFGQDFPDVFDMISNTSLYFINSDVFYDYPRPTMANVVFVGGLTMVEPSPLNEEWQKIVDTSRKNGIILFSLGSVTNTNMMPPATRIAFINAFKRFSDFTIVWKYDGNPEDLKSAPNVIPSQWVPQKDFLTEAAAAGVPLVVLPLFGDQPANAKRYEWFKTAVSLEKNNLTEENIVNAIRTVISDENYGKRAQRLAKMIKKKPMTSLDSLVGWLDFMAEFKTLEILRPEGNQLSLFQYFLLDVFMMLSLFLSGIIGVSCLGCRLCCRLCCRKTTLTDTKRKKIGKKAKMGKTE